MLRPGRMFRLGPGNGGHHIKSLAQAIADEIPAALAVPAKIERQHVVSALDQILGQIKLPLLGRSDSMTQHHRALAPILGQIRIDPPWELRRINPPARQRHSILRSERRLGVSQIVLPGIIIQKDPRPIHHRQ